MSFSDTSVENPASYSSAGIDMLNQTTGQSFTAPTSTTNTPSGYTFSGWSTADPTITSNTDANGVLVNHDASYIGAGTNSIVPASNVTYYAVYTANTGLTLSFSDTSVENPASYSNAGIDLTNQTTGQSFTAPTSTTNTPSGYTFSGWSTADPTITSNTDANGVLVNHDASYIGAGINSIVPASNVTYYAVYTANTGLTLSFSDTSVENPASYSNAGIDLTNQTTGQSFTAPTSTTNTPSGYTFSGWSTADPTITSNTDVNGVLVNHDASYIGAGTNSIVPASNVTYYAVYTANTGLTLSFSDTSVENPASYSNAGIDLTNQTTGQSFTAPTSTTNTPSGYTFSGWSTADPTITSNTDVNGVLVNHDASYIGAGTNSIVPASNVTYYAVYTANTGLTLSFSDTSVENPASYSNAGIDLTNQTTGQSFTAPTSTTNTPSGYTFSGWSTADPTITSNTDVNGVLVNHDASYIGAGTNSIVPASNVTYYAVYTANTGLTLSFSDTSVENPASYSNAGIDLTNQTRVKVSLRQLLQRIPQADIPLAGGRRQIQRLHQTPM